jgi:sarcosine oxidase subunit gamma
MMGSDINKAYRQADGSLAALLSSTEVLWLGVDADEGDLARWHCADGQPLAPQTYALPRRDGTYWFQFTGDGTATVFSRLCGVDLSLAAFADLAVAQTLIARVSAVIIRADGPRGPSYHIIGDISLAPYIWDVLVAAMRP